MGRIAKISDEQKKLQGHGRFVKSVPDVKPILRMWPTPEGLGDSGHQLWEEQGPLLVKGRVLTDLDKPAFHLLCQSLDLIRYADETLSRDGLTVEGRDSLKAHPAARIRKDAMADFLRLCGLFGLSPYDRSKIDLKIDSQPQDKVREFLLRNNR